MQRNITNVSQLVSRSLPSKRSRKKVQFTTIFHLLTRKRSMLQYEESRALFKHLGVKIMGRLHLSDNVGWDIAVVLSYTKSLLW